MYFTQTICDWICIYMVMKQRYIDHTGIHNQLANIDDLDERGFPFNKTTPPTDRKLHCAACTATVCRQKWTTASETFIR